MVLQGSQHGVGYGQYGEGIMTRYTIEPDLSDNRLQQRLLEIKEELQKEIRRVGTEISDH